MLSELRNRTAGRSWFVHELAAQLLRLCREQEFAPFGMSCHTLANLEADLHETRRFRKPVVLYDDACLASSETDNELVRPLLEAAGGCYCLASQHDDVPALFERLALEPLMGNDHASA